MILLGVGSNLSSSFGNRFKNIDLAISALNQHGLITIKKSSYYESLSYPDINKPKFINIIIEMKTDLTPEDLAGIIIFIEESLERKRVNKNDPRTCDIDIIDFNNKILDFNYKNLKFSVPHKMIKFRNFVLYPLQEIKPNWQHPKTKDLVVDLIENLNDQDKKSILKVNKY